MPPTGRNAAAAFLTFRQYADSLPIMTWQLNTNCDIVFCNAAWFAFTRIPADSMTHASDAWGRCVHPDDLVHIGAALDRAKQSMAGFDLQLRAKPMDGDDAAYRWFQCRAVPQFVDDEFLGWIGSQVDVTDSVERSLISLRLERENKRHEDEFKAFGDSIPQIVWTATAEGWIDWYNHKWYDYTGQTREEAAGWGWQAVHHPDDFLEVMREWPLSIASGEPFEMEFRLRGADGAYRWFLTRSDPYRDESGTIVRWFGLNTDIDDQKREVEKTRRIAETLQRVFLPDQLPERDNLWFDAIYLASERDALVGGDWYDAFDLADGRVVISIGDVAGHGLDAAVVAGKLRQVIFAEALYTHDPATVLAKGDAFLRARGDTIATAVVAILDPRTGALTYASAGHPMPLVISPGDELLSLNEGGAPLGTGALVDGAIAETYEAVIADDALVVFFTDGLIEFERNALAGEQRLRSIVTYAVAANGVMSAQAIVESVLNGKHSTDDIALLMMSRSLVRVVAESITSLVKTWRFHSSHAFSARRARIELVAFLRQLAMPGSDLFAAELVLGEILANTVEHATGLVEVVIDWTGEQPAIRVRDSGPGPAKLTVRRQLPESDYDENGRGLFLVNELSTSFHVGAAPERGTEMSVVLPLLRN